ncbi:hypothetical protein R5H30_02655 [Sulfitobacter sp. D35]|uniref:hypothetical protein n=1 Tax=Sulfitobacter sp. D35 TaxID=3083252 RepID=UPI00296EA89C|nr:hypothetical protein [Sulfitobacter sp. D35]MDW4496867.1 hypothetical protein [Sulfitobacter sp. D35]
MADRFSLKDHLFNAETVGQLAGEYAAALPGFDADCFREEALAGFADRELLQRLDWLADCAERQLPRDFPEMAEALEAAMPAPLDPARSDDDFGQFIHAVPGILAVRHGLEDHRERALDLIHAATQRFSMEFYVRPFLNRWPEETLARLAVWAEDRNYHVRRLVSEGTRPRLPWAKAVTLTPSLTLPLLDRLHGDMTRYVTRSVANHLNDIAKKEPATVLDRLADWRKAGRQDGRELAWMARHALRTLVKQGDAAALAHLGYSTEAPVEARLEIATPSPNIGDVLAFTCHLSAPDRLPVLVDYRISFARPGGKRAEKVFKLKQAELAPGEPLSISKKHRLKGDATTFTLHPGRHDLTLQVNGVDRATATFELR